MCVYDRSSVIISVRLARIIHEGSHWRRMIAESKGEVGAIFGRRRSLHYVKAENREASLVDRLASPQSYGIVGRCEEIALDAWRVLGCRDAGRVDLRCDAAGNPLFMEVNPLAGLHPVHSDLPIICKRLGIPFEKLIGRIVASARERVGPAVDRSVRMRQCA